jgi:ATP-dependent DNA ligase
LRRTQKIKPASTAQDRFCISSVAPTLVCCAEASVSSASRPEARCDWTEKYPTIAKSIAGLPARSAYLDGELCGVRPDGTTAFNLIQNATDTGEGSLVFFLFDLLHLDGENMTALPLVDRKTRLASLLHGAPNSLRYNDHQIGHGPAFHRLACERGLEGIVSKRTNGRYEPGGICRGRME